MEPLNKGYVGTRSFVLYREVFFIRRLKCTGIIGIGMSRFVLYTEMFFIRRLKCTGIIGIGASRFVLYREVFLIRRLKCTSIIGIGTSIFVLCREVSFIRGSTVLSMECLVTGVAFYKGKKKLESLRRAMFIRESANPTE